MKTTEQVANSQAGQFEEMMVANNVRFDRSEGDFWTSFTVEENEMPETEFSSMAEDFRQSNAGF